MPRVTAFHLPICKSLCYTATGEHLRHAAPAVSCSLVLLFFVTLGHMNLFNLTQTVPAPSVSPVQPAVTIVNAILQRQHLGLPLRSVKQTK
jgi:hypothetical protein